MIKYLEDQAVRKVNYDLFFFSFDEKNSIPEEAQTKLPRYSWK